MKRATALEALLWLYPPSHRRLYGQEMINVARHRIDRAGGGLVSKLAAAGGLVRGAAGVWKDQLGRKMAGVGRGWGLDVRFVARSLWRSRGYVLTTLVVLAAAVAANATVFSYVRGTLMTEPSYPDAESVLVVWGSNVANGQLRDVVSGPNFIDLQRRSSTFEKLAALHEDGAYVLVNGRPEVISALEVSVDFFDIVRVVPAMGRVFDTRDRMSGEAETVVITHGFWRDRLGADPGIIGRPLDFEGDPRTVIGVLPEGFEFIQPVSLFIPLHDDELAVDERMRIHYHLIGRLRPGASLADGSRELGVIAGELAAEYPAFTGWGFLAEPLHDVSVAAVRPVILILTVTVGLVLVVALVNLATLFRIRAHTRAAEISVRAALGAGRARLIRVLALETTGLSALGAAAGLAVTPFILAYVAQLVPAWITIPQSAVRVPVLVAVLDRPVAMVAFAGAVLGALLLTVPGVVSTLRVSNNLTGGSGRRVHGPMRSMRVLVGVELVVATVLCVGAALTARSAAHLLSEEVGINADGLLTLYFGDVWGLDAEGKVQYFREAVDAVEGVPGVVSAGVIDYVDFRAEDDYAHVYLLDRSFEPVFDMREEWRRVDTGLFETAGMRMVAGRGFEELDFQNTPRTAVVNEAFATKHYPGRSPVGEYLSTHDDAYRDMEIVGIVADVRSLGPASPPPPMLYVPNHGSPRGTQGMYVRVAGAPMSVAGAVREAIWSVDPSQPIQAAQPMAGLVDSWVAIPRATRLLVFALATLAWLLSAVGVFGVVSYVVRTRRSEMGIRLALGASPKRLRSDLLRTISPVVVVGVGIGLTLGVLGARAAATILYSVSPADTLSLLSALLAMCVAAFLAAYVPACRVGRVDPAEVIRAE